MEDGWELQQRGLPRRQYAGRVSSSADLASYTFTAAPIGQAASDRLLCFAMYKGAASGGTITSLTLNGSGAGVVIDATTNESDAGDVIFAYAPFPAGETADIVVTLSTGAARLSVDVYAIYGLTSFTPVHVLESDTGSALALTPVTDAVIIATTAMNTAGTRTIAATNTADFRLDVDSDVETGHHSSASAIATAASSSVTTTSTQDLAAICWR